MSRNAAQVDLKHTTPNLLPLPPSGLAFSNISVESAARLYSTLEPIAG